MLYNLSSWYNANHTERIQAYCIEIPSYYTAYDILCWAFDFDTQFCFEAFLYNNFKVLSFSFLEWRLYEGLVL